MRYFAILATGIAVVSLGGCGLSSASTGTRVDRNFEVGSFTGIEVAGPYDVTVRTGSTVGVHANGTEKALGEMRVEVKGDRLEITPLKRHKWGFNWGWQSSSPVSLTVTVPVLDHAGIAGSGAITVDKVSGAKFTGEIAGSGDLMLSAIDAGEVKLSIAGSGAIQAGGKAKSVKYEIAGSGDIDAAGLTAETAEVSIAGSGGVKGHASGTARVEMMGSGDVELTGGAKCSVTKNGSGDIRCS